MRFDLDQAMAVLARTPATLRALLSGLSREWVAGTEGPGRWSPYDVIGHLIHCENTDWIPRARLILEHGTSRTFEPFDREYMMRLREGHGPRLDVLHDEFARLRAANLELLRAWKLGPADFERRGVHPEFGEVTLGQLLATWVVHDLDHVTQVARVMAKQYSEAVGPWTAYLSVLGDRKNPGD